MKTDSEIKETIDHANRYGLKLGLSYEQAQDFAQEHAYQVYVKGHDMRLYYSWVSFMKKEYGNVTNWVGNLRSLERRTMLSDEARDVVFKQMAIDKHNDEQLHQDKIERRRQILSELSHHQRRIVILVCSGLNSREIAKRYRRPVVEIRRRILKLKRYIRSFEELNGDH